MKRITYTCLDPNSEVGYVAEINFESHIALLSEYTSPSSTIPAYRMTNESIQEFISLIKSLPEDTNKHNPRLMGGIDDDVDKRTLEITYSDEVSKWWEWEGFCPYTLLLDLVDLLDALPRFVIDHPEIFPNQLFIGPIGKTLDAEKNDRGGFDVQGFKNWVAEVQSCTLCRDQNLLHCEAGNKWAKPILDTGVEKIDPCILAVLEAPNWDDTYHDDKGYLTYHPGTDPSGKFMLKLLDSVGIATNRVVFVNVVQCLPAQKNSKYLVTAAQAKICMRWLNSLIEVIDPKVIVSFGGAALAGLARLEKHGLQLSSAIGQAYHWRERHLLPLYHPGRLGRITRSAEKQFQDIQALRYLVGLG